MAKKKIAEVVNIATKLPAAIRRGITNTKRAVLDTSAKHGLVREKMKDLAPKVIPLYLEAAAAVPGFTLADFAREYDDTVPTWPRTNDVRDGVPGYQAHPVYNTLTYMKRLIENKRREEKREEDKANGVVQPKPVNVFAMALKLLIGLGVSTETVLKAVKDRANYTDRSLAILKTKINDAPPLLGVKMTATGIEVTDTNPQPATPLEKMTQGGQSVDLEKLKGKLRASIKGKHARRAVAKSA